MQGEIVPLELEDYEVRAMADWKRRRMSPGLVAAFEALHPRAQFVVFARVHLGWKNKWVAQRIGIRGPNVSRIFRIAMNDLRDLIRKDMPDHAHRT